MHGLINQAIERFARATYGNGFWERVCRRRNLPVLTFEAMQSYDPEVTEALLDGMAQVLGKPRGEVLEDIGTFLVSSPSTGALRRLLRFGGTGFVDFLLSLDDLPARVRLGCRSWSCRRWSCASTGRGRSASWCARKGRASRGSGT